MAAEGSYPKSVFLHRARSAPTWGVLRLPWGLALLTVLITFAAAERSGRQHTQSLSATSDATRCVSTKCPVNA